MCSRRTLRCGQELARRQRREVVLFADTFNRYFERENLDAALAVLSAGGYRVHLAQAGRRFVAAAVLRPHVPLHRQVDEARKEAERTLAALDAVRVARRAGGRPGAELPAQLPRRSPGDDQGRARAAACRARADLRGIPGARSRRPAGCKLPLKKIADRALLHGHCHQKAFDALQPGRDTCSSWCPISRSRPIESSCCGMAGSFGYDADTIDVSLAMGELSLLPAVRKARRRHASSSPTAPPAATRSTTAPGATRSMSRACWR